MNFDNKLWWIVADLIEVLIYETCFFQNQLLFNN
jgi:hypothetical protein